MSNNMYITCYILHVTCYMLHVTCYTHSSPHSVLLCPVTDSQFHLGITSSTHHAVRNVKVMTPRHSLGVTTMSKVYRGQLLDLVTISDQPSGLLALTSDQKIAVWHTELGVQLKVISVCSSMPCLLRVIHAQDCQVSICVCCVSLMIIISYTNMIISN